MTASLLDRVRWLLDLAGDVFDEPEHRDVLATARSRLDEPLRVAIAGKVKAGKSTLLNALVGERLAPTDTSECTRIVTWYRDGLTYRVIGRRRDGEAVPLRFERAEGAIEIDLGSHVETDLEALEVTWPSSRLRRTTLIDTPGVGSLSAEVANRTFEFLDPDEADSPADAVLFLMKHVHRSDLDLLEAFHDTSMALPNAVNAIAVLARADEVGAARLDAMGSARRIARRYGDDPRIRRLVQIVVPVAGLLAETAATLTETEFGHLRALAMAEPSSLEAYLLSADRFIEAEPSTPLTSIERRWLLERLGIYGIRVALVVLRRRPDLTSGQLAEELRRRSGVAELSELLSTLFVDRSDVLKARTILLAVERLCAASPTRPGVSDVLAALEEVTANAHPFRELSTLAALRSGWVTSRPQVIADLERTLGAQGSDPKARLGLDSPDVEVLRAEAVAQIARWQRLGENPMTSRDLTVAIQVAVRSLEGVVAELADRSC